MKPSLPSNSKSTKFPKISYLQPSNTLRPSLLPFKIDLRSVTSAINFSANPLSSEQYKSRSFNKSKLDLSALHFLLFIEICSYVLSFILSATLIIFIISFKSL